MANVQIAELPEAKLIHLSAQETTSIQGGVIAFIFSELHSLFGKGL